MKIIISDDDGVVLDTIVVPFDFDEDEIAACNAVRHWVECNYEVPEEDGE